MKRPSLKGIVLLCRHGLDNHSLTLKKYLELEEMECKIGEIRIANQLCKKFMEDIELYDDKLGLKHSYIILRLGFKWDIQPMTHKLKTLLPDFSLSCIPRRYTKNR